MKARGPSYRFNNENNNLTKNWIKPVQYSSWCMFEKRKHQKDNLLVSENFGQINYFSRLSCYNDEHVNGLAFANITSYKHIEGKKVNGIEASGVYTIYSNSRVSPITNIFIPLRFFVSSKVGFLPLDSSDKPIKTAVKRLSKLSEESISHCSLVGSSEEINKLIMIPLQPYRKGITMTLDSEENLDYKRKF